MDFSSTKLHQRLKRYIARFLKQQEDIEDIAQDSILKVLEAGANGEIHYPEAYLYRTARNLAINWLARKGDKITDSVEDFLDPEVLFQTGPLDDDIAAQQRFELLCRAISSLPEQCRRVVILRKVYGYSQREAAEQLGISISTLEKHLAKGLLRCREHMATLQAEQDIEVESKLAREVQ